MLRALAVSLGFVLFLGFPGTLGQRSAFAAAMQRTRKTNAQEPSARSRDIGKAFDTASSKKKSSATRSATSKNNRKKPPEVKLKPANPVAPEPAPAASTVTATSAPPPTRGPTRMDFDDRLIQGQTNKSGAVYLYDRKELKTASMIKKRESFRDEILATVYGN